MKVIRFPGGDSGPQVADADPGATIDAELNGETAGPQATALRELRDDVRALAVPVDPAFERELQARVAEWGAQGQARRRPSLNQLAGRLRRWITGSVPHALAAAGGVVTVAALIVAVVVVGSSSNPVSSAKSGRAAVAVMGLPTAEKHAAKTNDDITPFAREISPSAHELGPTSAEESTAASSTAAPGRLQQLGASVTLATGSNHVQEAADSVTRLGVSDGGYVQSSHVQVRQGGASEATLSLSIPSAKLSSTIAALGRIAPLRAVNQESQDITEPFDTARRRLGDDEAVRRALLRALAAAETQGEIESLRDRLSGNRATISRDRAAVHAVSQRAANSQLEVTITGAAGHAGSSHAHEGLTLRRGLRDAGHVLAGVGAVLLIALAVIVPLALVALALDALRRAWLRRRREAVLDS
jgi:hypothetical protein